MDLHKIFSFSRLRKIRDNLKNYECFIIFTMIDDSENEDPEELLKRKISWKSVLKGIFVGIIMIGSVVIIQLSRMGVISGNWLWVGFILLCISSSLIVPRKHEEKPMRQTLSLLKCEKCGIQKVRDYLDGDYIYKPVGVCSKCNEKMQIMEIYSVKLKEKSKKADKKKKSNRE